MAAASETGRFVDSVFKAWNAARIDFLVLRNYESLPEHTTNDIDCLVRKGQAEHAETELLRVAAEHGFKLHNRAEFATLALYFSNALNQQIHFDLFSSLKWRSFEFLETVDFLEHRKSRDGFYVPSAAHEAATNLLATMIYTGRVKEKYKASIALGFAAEPDRATELLAASYGEGAAKQIVAFGRDQNWTGLAEMTRRLRRALVFRQLVKKMPLTVAAMLKDLRRLIRRWMQPPGMLIALCGPDGCGKSTMAESILSDLSGTFSPLKSRQYHWKIPIFSKNRLANRPPVSDPHAKPPRGRVPSLAFFAGQCLEFAIGSRMVTRLIAFRGGLVLIDRYYYDFFVDPRRYRLQIPNWALKIGYFFVRKPDLVFLLDAPPEVLQSRKKEVAFEETIRQQRDYRLLAATIPQIRIVDAAKPAEEVSREAENTILEWMARRTAERWPHTVSRTLHPSEKLNMTAT